jgi:hypothetical protein
MNAPTLTLHSLAEIAWPVPRPVLPDAGLANRRQRHDIDAGEWAAPFTARPAMQADVEGEGIGPTPITNAPGA